MTDVSVIIPARNEFSNLKALIPELQKALGDLSYEILIVDDGTDETPAYVHSLGRPNIVCYRREERGFANAIAFGIGRARGEYVLVMDADFNHHPGDAARLIQKMGEADAVLASRYLSGGGSDYPLRHLLSGWFNAWVRAVLKTPCTDHLFGLYLVRRDTVADLDAGLFQGFGEYSLRFWNALHRRGVGIIEVPAWHGRRRHGRGNLRLWKTFMIYVKTVLEIR